MKVIENVKTGAKATTSFVGRHKKAFIGGTVAVLAAIGAAIGIQAASNKGKPDAPETTEPSEEPTSEE